MGVGMKYKKPNKQTFIDDKHVVFGSVRGNIA